MWRRAADKLLSLRFVTSSPWSARVRTSGSLSKSRQDVTPFPIATGLKRVELEPAVMKSVAKPIPVVATPLFSIPYMPCSGPELQKLREKSGYDEYELDGNDLVDYDFVNSPFGTEEKPTVMRSFYAVQITYCCGPEEERHDNQFFWIRKGVITVCPLCSQHFTLECVGRGGAPPSLYEMYM